MTAVIGILNKEAVAVAADSAVTIGWENGRKIYNTANKIFTLSKHAPVGVALYNSASFMTTPWETIVKIYREQLGKKAFGTLDEYQQDFFRFLKEKNYFVDVDFQKAFFLNILRAVFNYINNEALQNQARLLMSESDEDRSEVVELIKTRIEKLESEISTNFISCPEFTDYTLENFLAFAGQPFDEAIKQVYTDSGYALPDVSIEQLKRICFLHLRSQFFLEFFTGLIFFGFGEDEIYPSLITVNVSGVFDDRLRYFIPNHETSRISNQQNAAINPFAQTDVIDTILSGVDPALDEFYINQHGDFLKKYNQDLASLVQGLSPELAEHLKNLDVTNIVNEYRKESEKIKLNKYIIPLMSAVANLSKDDLSEMAESLVYLTYLKRRITFTEESVGGPVDVAIISKGDGFIWKKRKHYFKPELNQHFFANYFKNS